MQGIVDFSGSTTPVPPFCDTCGEKFPWADKLNDGKGQKGSDTVHEKLKDTSLPGLLRAAITAVPAVKYALGVAGVLSALALVKGFFSSTEGALLAAVGMLALMVLLVVFAAMSKLGPSALKMPALVFTWTILVLFIVSACLAVSSMFFQYPTSFPELMRQLRGQSQTSLSNTDQDPSAPPNSAPERSGPVSAKPIPDTTKPLITDEVGKGVALPKEPPTGMR